MISLNKGLTSREACVVGKQDFEDGCSNYVRFKDDESGYVKWLHDNPEGFVLNTHRNGSQTYNVIHTACGRHTLGLLGRYDEGAFTCRSYEKICSLSLDALKRFADQRGAAYRLCDCLPSR